MSRVKIPYGRECIEFTVPDANLIGVYSPQDFPTVADLKNEILRAINPIGTRPVRERTRHLLRLADCPDDKNCHEYTAIRAAER